MTSEMEIAEAISNLQPDFDRMFSIAFRSQLTTAYFHPPSVSEQVRETISNMIQHVSLSTKLSFEAFKSTALAAHDLLSDIYAKAHICSALRSVSGDAFEVSKSLVPVLATLSAAGTISLQITPLVIGFASLLIARMGISSFCSDAQPTSKVKKIGKKRTKR